MSFNHVVLSGNVVRDAQLRSGANGANALGFTIAVNERRKNQQSGEWEDNPNYFDCVLFGARAEKLAPMLAKGTKAAIVGKLRQATWKDKDGKVHHKVDVVVDDIELPRSQGAAPAAPVQEEMFAEDVVF